MFVRTMIRLIPIGVSVFLISSVVQAQDVTARVVLSDSVLVNEIQLNVGINIDMQDVSELLGAYSASLRWNPEILEFLSISGGTTSGFDSPNVNQNYVSSGHVLFNQFNPPGSNGDVNVINMTFNTIGAKGDTCMLFLELSALGAAHTFTDLLPYLAIEDASVRVRPAGSGPIVWAKASEKEVYYGQTFCVEIWAENVTDLGGYRFSLSFDNTSIKAIGARDGSFLRSTGRTAVESENIVNNPNGIVTLAYHTEGTGEGPDGGGILGVIDFRAKEEMEDAVESLTLWTGADDFK